MPFAIGAVVVGKPSTFQTNKNTQSRRKIWKGVINLIHKYLRSDIINEELFEMSTQESPPRGSLSPLLGNIIPMNWIGT